MKNDRMWVLNIPGNKLGINLAWPYILQLETHYMQKSCVVKSLISSTVTPTHLFVVQEILMHQTDMICKQYFGIL